MYNPTPRPRPAHLGATLLGIGLAAGCGPTLGAAGPAPNTIAGCAAIAADQARLACYDRLSGRADTAATGPSAERTAMSAPPAAVTPESPMATSDSLIDAAWGFSPDSSRYAISLYRPNYLQVASYSSRPNDAAFEQLFTALDDTDAELDSTEAQFQISFKARLWATEDRRFGVWAAYTQQSQWQVYNDDLSRPFRETNYQPELILSYNPELSFGGFNWRLFNVGYNHQSNGRSDPISRSWDRLIAEFGIERGNLALLIRPWAILNDGDDDNPEIEDYMGWGDITALYKWRDNSFTLMGRGNPDTGKGAAQFTWTSSPILGPLRGYVSAFTGYGETMIDYDWNQNTVGIGVALNDLLDRP